ncbi:MAG TPA: hypothetical protein VFL92_08030 [Sphingomonas sp.]|nr:hypothetical protein [Sphingomonas sp.]
MFGKALIAAGAALATASPALAAPDGSHAMTRINAVPARAGWFVCDAVSGPYALFAGKADAKGNSLITLLDRRTGRFDTQSYRVGRADPGAGQIYWSLSQKGREVGHVHGVNPGMIDDDGATIAPIVEVKLGAHDLQCRWLAHMRFIGLDSRRSVVVTQGPEGLVYQSFDFRKRGPVTHPDGVQVSNKPTLRIAGGSEMTGSLSGFRFVNQGYVYFIERPKHGEPAAVLVNHKGRQIGVDRLVGFTYAPPAGDPAVKLGRRDVWSGRGLDRCRQGNSATAVDDCLVATMRRTGATPAAIAFTRGMIAKDDPGYVSGWRQAGPVGIATVTFPFRANTNEGTMLVPSAGAPIMVDEYKLSAADKARPDYRAVMKRHPDAWPVAPAEVSAPKVAPGKPFVILARTRLSTCHACASVGAITVAWRFDAQGRLIGKGLVRVQ